MKETRLFLADIDYVSIGNANRARTITPSTVAVFLQINLWIVQAKSDGSEKPPLKIGVSNCLLYDGFFLLPSCGSYILGDNQLSILFIAVLYILFVRLWEARHTELQPIPALHEWALPSDE